MDQVNRQAPAPDPRQVANERSRRRARKQFDENWPGQDELRAGNSRERYSQPEEDGKEVDPRRLVGGKS